MKTPVKWFLTNRKPSAYTYTKIFSKQFPVETIKRYYKINKKEICFVKSILEAYDGMAVLRTVDPNEGIIEISIIPGCEEDITTILNDLRNYISIDMIKGNI